MAGREKERKGDGPPCPHCWQTDPGLRASPAPGGANPTKGIPLPSLKVIVAKLFLTFSY